MGYSWAALGIAAGRQAGDAGAYDDDALWIRHVDLTVWKCSILKGMTTIVVSQLVYLLDEAFQGADWHSLLTNLGSVTPADWCGVAPGGRRSIRDIVQHVGGAKLVYQNRAFGDGQLTWDDPAVEGGDALDHLGDDAARPLSRGRDQLHAPCNSETVSRRAPPRW
jgi:hypothetical protein